MTQRIVIGTRGSQLALVQTNLISELLKAAAPGLDVNIKKITTSGDRDRHTQLDRLEVSAFVKELEEALLDGRIDLAVHSLKDVPTDIPDGLTLMASPQRADPRDVLVAKSKLEDLPSGAKIGTGSLRRSLQITQLRPDIETCGLRGNMDTRVRKASSGELDGVITASAALSRLEWQDKIRQYLPADAFLPAAGQGALVIEGRSRDKELIALVSKINHLPTWQAVTAERAFLRELGGGCRAPIAALGTVSGGKLRLEGMVAGPTSRKIMRDSIEGEAASAEKLGLTLAQKMLKMGASQFMAEVMLDEAR